MRSAAPAACEGALLVVDASQGVEAQTLANVYQAIDTTTRSCPVLNKIDLPAAEPERSRQQIEDVIGIDASDAVLISAKTGIGIDDVLEAIVTRLPAAQGRPRRAAEGAAGRQLVRPYLGVVVLVRVIDGVLKKGQKHPHDGTGAEHLIDRVGVFTPKMVDIAENSAPARSASSPPDQGSRRHPRRRHHHRRTQAARRSRCPASSRSSRWCSAACSRSTPRLSRTCAKAIGQAAPQRRQLQLRDGNQRRARLRLPLRLPRPAAPGNHPGALSASSTST
jgi:hypothetical protein